MISLIAMNASYTKCIAALEERASYILLKAFMLTTFVCSDVPIRVLPNLYLSIKRIKHLDSTQLPCYFLFLNFSYINSKALLKAEETRGFKFLNLKIAFNSILDTISITSLEFINDTVTTALLV